MQYLTDLRAGVKRNIIDDVTDQLCLAYPRLHSTYRRTDVTQISQNV